MEPAIKRQETNRKSLLDSSLRTYPFQLLPRVVHPPEALEAALVWQNRFALSLPRAPFLNVIISSAISNLERTIESLEIQSYPFFSVSFLGEGDLPAASHSTQQIYNVRSLREALVSGSGTNSAQVFICGEAILHPSTLLIIAKELIRTNNQLLYANEVRLNKENSATTYFRRTPASKFDSLCRNPFGAVFALPYEESAKLKLDGQTDIATLPWDLALTGIGSRLIPLGLIMMPEKPLEQSYPIESAIIDYASTIGVSISSLEKTTDGHILPRLAKASRTVTVVIPFHNQADVTSAAIKALSKQTGCEQFELILVNNRSTTSEVDRVRSCIARSPFRNAFIVDDDGYFNFARLNNFGAQHASAQSEFVLFMNNDVELSTPETLSELISWGIVPDVGVVGGELRFPDGNLQHAGINFLSVRPANVREEAYFSHLPREVNAVSFALALVRRELFEKLKLDEINCPNGFGDALYCHEARKLGFRSIFTPTAKAIHHESITRGRLPEELELFEMASHDLPISDLWGDFGAELQPTALNLVQPQLVVMREDEMPLARLIARILGSPRMLRVTNSLASLILRAGRALKTL